MRHLYSALLYALLPLVLLRLLLRSLRAPDYRRRLGERCGWFRPPPAASHGAIWVHAVSVGEVRAALPLLAALREGWPEYPLVVTTTTPTASALLRAHCADEVFHVYLPWDLPGAARRFVRRVRPALLILMETELWPNLLWQCRLAGCRAVLANARLSAASARRYRRLGALTRATLDCLDLVACQSGDDRRRFLELGVPPARAVVTGAMKFDARVDGALRARAAELGGALHLGARPVVVAASTHPGEEEAVLDALAMLRERGVDCLPVIAPRHPERAPAVAALCRARGWRPLLRSAAAAGAPPASLLILDSIGELPALYGHAQLVFLGGSLVPAGGHNPIEAALWGVPVLCGPHVDNFAWINRALAEAGALLTVASGQALGESLLELLAVPQRRAAMGAAAREAVRKQRGATRHLLRALSPLL